MNKSAILRFLGTGAAFTVGSGNYQSSMILEYDNQKLLIDCGSDTRFSLFDQNLTHRDILSVFVSHLHSDHVGGLEWLAFKTKFDKHCERPNLFIADTLVGPIWNNVLSGGLSSLENCQAALDTYFNVHIIKNNSFVWNSLPISLVPTRHFKSNSIIMPTYGLFFSINGTKIWISNDTQFTPDELKEYYETADIIFHDCETTETKTHVHAHYSELVTLSPNIKKKMLLYDYNPGPLPDAAQDGFKGFVKKGQVFTFN
jgi:ribonuclease BN (tRNA processing enzyme)